MLHELFRKGFNEVRESAEISEWGQLTIIYTEIIPYKLVKLVLISNAFSIGMLLSGVELNDCYKGFYTELRARSTYTVQC